MNGGMSLFVCVRLSPVAVLTNILFFLFEISTGSFGSDGRGPSFHLPAVLAAPNGLLGIPRGAGTSQLHPH